MPERNANINVPHAHPASTVDAPWDRRLPLYSYLEPLWAGRKVLEVGCGVGTGSDYLISHGAARVVGIDVDATAIERARLRHRRASLEFRAVAHLADLGQLTDQFDIVVVPAADAQALRGDMITAWKRLLADGGRLVVSTGNADRTGVVGGAAPAGVGYYQLTDALSPHFSRVQMFGQTPFVGFGMIEFDSPAEGLRVDTRLLEGEGESASHYVAIAGAADAVPLGYALVQVPSAPVESRLAAAPTTVNTAVTGVAGEVVAREVVSEARRALFDRDPDDLERKARVRLEEAEGRISDLRRRLDDATVQSESALRIARAQGEEIEDLRGRVRRAMEDRATLDTEIGKLRRALADADESVMTLTRRTAEEMTAVAERLSANLRAPEDNSAGRARLAEYAAMRDQAEELRARLAETEARAGAAERRLEETATISRDREQETVDLRARLRRAEDAVERERLAVSLLQEQARIAVAEIEQLAGRADALLGRDERIARLEGEKQDLAWRTAELEEKLRTAIARAVSLDASRGSAGAAPSPMTFAPLAPLSAPPSSAATSRASSSSPSSSSSSPWSPLTEELAAARAARDRALEEFHKAAASHVDEVTRLQGSVAEQSVLVAELEDAVKAAETRAATATGEVATLKKNARELEEADRTRRSRLAELEGKLLRLEHEKKAAVQAATGDEELGRKLQITETERELLRAERDQLRARADATEVAAAQARDHGAGGNGTDSDVTITIDMTDELGGIEEGLRAEMRTLASLEAAVEGELASRASGIGDVLPAPPGGDVGLLQNTLGNFRRRALQLRDELEGYRRRVESLSPSDITVLLQELGEGLAEFEG
jgi:SAM-dependent methyltransferase